MTTQFILMKLDGFFGNESPGGTIGLDLIMILQWSPAVIESLIT